MRRGKMLLHIEEALLALAEWLCRLAVRIGDRGRRLMGFRRPG